MGSVVAGCLIGLVINNVFRKLVGAVYGPIPVTASETPENPAKSDGAE
jgi:hypothetical protein